MDSQLRVDVIVDGEELTTDASELNAVSRLARRVMRSALTVLGWDLGPLEVTLTLTGDAQIRALNRQYRSRDESTDVLSFPLLEHHEIEALRQGRRPPDSPLGAPLLLGDIVLNLMEAERAARRYGHSRQREIGFLVVHGFLHLLGFDHDEPAAAERMNHVTERALSRLGLTRDGGR